MSTAEASSSTITSEMLATLSSDFEGEIVQPGSSFYDQSRSVWNGNIDRYPGAIAHCSSVADVQTAVRFAAANNLVIAVRGGAHNAAGLGTCDGGIVIDTSRMKDAQVDVANRIVRCGPGLTWAEFDAETLKHGLATTGGTVSNTGIAGLTLGGGVGWLMGKHGLTVDNLLAVELVTAGGDMVRADAATNPDLFWALRGGGGNFGIVTAFEYQLHPVPEVVLGGLMAWPLDRAGDVLRFYRDFAPTLPDGAELFAALVTAPTGDVVVALLPGYNGPFDKGQNVFAPLAALGEPALNMVGPMPYGVRQALLDDPNAIHGLQRYWKSGFATELPDALIDAATAAAGAFTSPMSAVLFLYIHGAATRVDPAATAFALRRPQWDVNIVGQWEQPSESAGHIDWVRTHWAAFEPNLSGAAYVNHIAADDSVEKVRASYGENLSRLARMKGQYDPGNLFRLNANIQPA